MGFKFDTFTEPILVIVSISLALYGYIQRQRRLPLPPGPHSYPLIGNLLDIPASFQWETFMKWSEEYRSDVLFAKTIGVNIIILNSFKGAEDLLVKRSSIYSSRPQFLMLNMMGWGFQFSLMPYGEIWRDRRRLFQKHFPLGRHDHYRPVIKHFVKVLLVGLLEHPEEFYDRIKHMSGAFALATGYGIELKPINDPYVEFSRETLGEVMRAGAVGNYMVDIVPALRHLPEWMPGAGFKRQARIWSDVAREFINRPFDEGSRKCNEGTNLNSFLSMSLTKLPDAKDKERELAAIKDTATMFYTGGSDTTVSALYTFVLMMTLHPDIQEKIQKEIDENVGHDRLPDFEDEPDMPYLTAVLLEIIRWHPPIPMGVPHQLEEDDVYEGYRMPKGSMVVANCWAMVHNEEDYPDSFQFKPERFLKDGKINPDVRDPRSIIFGFGRRVCPGSHIAWSVLWYSVSSVLANFDILKPLNHLGEEVDPKVEFEPAIVSPPLEFDCRFKPRSNHRVGLVRMELDEARWKM